jgi:hypothetical protein
VNPTPASARVGAETASIALSDNLSPLRVEGAIRATPADAGAALFMHAGVRARADCASIETLKAEGWTIEHENVWGGALMRRELDS